MLVGEIEGHGAIPAGVGRALVADLLGATGLDAVPAARAEVCNLKVVRLDGRPMDVGVALVRALGSIFSFLALGIGFFWAGWSSERQSWHDKIAGTTIVKVPKGIPLI